MEFLEAQILDSECLPKEAITEAKRSFLME